MKKILMVAVLGLSSASAFAGSVNMSCAQAQNTYDTNGRIYVRTSHGTVVPIYGLKQSCPNNWDASPYFVNATDGRCFLGNYCYQDGGRR